MSKTNVRRPQKKTTLKKRQDWDVGWRFELFDDKSFCFLFVYL